MDPKVNPAGTLAQLDPNNPLVAAVTGSPVNQPQATATDTAQQPGAAALANPTASVMQPISGNATMAKILTSRGMDIPKPSVHATKIGNSISATLAADPGIAQRPGGTMRAIVGGALDALKGATEGLGDAAAATAPVPAGGGGLDGVLRTLAAHNQRVAGEKQQQFENTEKKRMDDANIAHAQMATLVAQQNLRLAGNEEKRKAYESDQAVKSDLDSAGVKTLGVGLDSDMVQKWYSEHPDQRGHMAAIVDHLEPQIDKDGNEFLRPIYSLYDMDGQVKVGDRTAALINKFAPQSQEVTPDTSMNAGAYINVVKQAKLAEVQDLSRQKLLAETAKNKAEADKWNEDVEKNTEHKKLGAEIANEMLQFGQDPVRALDALSKQKGDQAADMARKIVDYYGEPFINQLRRDAETERHNRQQELIDSQKVTQQRELEQGNTHGVAADMVGLTVAPPQLTKRSKDYNAVINEADKISMKQYGEKFDFEKAQRDYEYAKRPQTQDTLKYLNSLVGEHNDGGNLAALLDKSKQINLGEFPPLNDIKAWAKLQTGDKHIAGYRATLLEVSDQVAKILQGGGSGAGTSDAKLRQAQELFDIGFSKEMMEDVANSLQPLLGNRKREMIGTNKYLLKDFGEDYAPKNAVNPKQPGKAANGRPVWQTADGKIKDSTGRFYDPQTGMPVVID